MASCGKHPHIHRVDRPAKQLVGWVVQASVETTRFSRYFADKKSGGRKRAYAAAQQFALEMEDRSEFKALLSRLKPRRNSRSGTPGVTHYEGGSDRGPYWVAYWDEDGHKIQRKFSVSVYGEERARELAFSTRRKAMKEHARRLVQLRKHDAPILRALSHRHPQRFNAP